MDLGTVCQVTLDLTLKESEPLHPKAPQAFPSALDLKSIYVLAASSIRMGAPCAKDCLAFPFVSSVPDT